MKSLIQPFATLALAGATFLLGQNTPPPYQQEVRTRALVIVDGGGKEAGRFASLDNITTFSMTPVGQDIVRIKAREKQLDAFIGEALGGFTLHSGHGGTTFEMASDTNIGKDPTTFSVTATDGTLWIRGREPQSGGSINAHFENDPQRMMFGFGNKFGGSSVAVDSDGVFSSSTPKRKPAEGGG